MRLQYGRETKMGNACRAKHIPKFCDLLVQLTAYSAEQQTHHVLMFSGDTCIYVEDTILEVHYRAVYMLLQIIS